MDKIGILTLYRDNKNYGGLLQAYALQHIISISGFEAEMISFEPDRKKYILNRFKNLGIYRSLQVYCQKKKTKIYLMRHKMIRQKIECRNKKFKTFELSIPHSKMYTNRTIKQSNDEYDIFICGSDQIWNPAINTGVYFLDFVTGHKRIAYSASIGREQLNQKEKEIFWKNLHNFDMLSVREIRAKELIIGLTDTPVSLTLDPTLLLNMNQWKQLIRRPQNCPSKYAFAYFLGQNEENQKQVYKYCKKKELLVVNIPFLQTGFKRSDVEYTDISLYDISVGEWLYLVAYAECVFTDSFHGLAFSINFNKEVYCFEKNKSGERYTEKSRLLSLLTLLGIKDVMQGLYIKDYSIPYEQVNERLEEMRQVSYQYLCKALERDIVS